jgi:hypothetical protein
MAGKILRVVVGYPRSTEEGATKHFDDDILQHWTLPDVAISALWSENGGPTGHKV